MATAKSAAAKTAAKAKQNTVSLKHIAANLAENHELPKKQTEAMLNDVVALVTKHLKKGDRIRHLPGKAEFVGHDNHCHLFACQFAHHFQHLARQAWIERRGRLIKEHHLWLHCQRTGNRHPLLLPARHL